MITQAIFQWSTVAGTALGAAGLYLAQVPSVQQVLDAGTKAERMGIIGVLTALLIVSVVANVWLVRNGLQKLINLIERALTTLDRASESAERMARAAQCIDETTKRCQFARR